MSAIDNEPDQRTAFLMPNFESDADGKQVIASYTDPWGVLWRQGEKGWEKGTQPAFDESAWELGLPQAKTTWAATDTDPTKPGAVDLSGFDPRYLGNLAGHTGIGTDWLKYQDTQEFLTNFRYGGRYANINPYFSIGNRDALRQAAVSLGLTPQDADRAAFAEQQRMFLGNNQLYDEANSGLRIGNDIAAALYKQAGKPYAGVSAADLLAADNAAYGRQARMKSSDEDAWKADPIGGLLEFQNVVASDRWKANAQDPERILLGAEGPLGTAVWNKVLNKDWDPTINLTGGPVKQDYQQASKEGVDTTGASVLQFVLDTTAAKVGTPAAAAGLGDLVDAAGVDPSYLQAVQYANQAYGLYNAYEKYQDQGAALAKYLQQLQQKQTNVRSENSSTGKPVQKRTEQQEQDTVGGLMPSRLVDVYKQYQAQRLG